MRTLAALALLAPLAAPAHADLTRIGGGGGGDGLQATDAAVECGSLAYRGALYAACPSQQVVRRILPNGVIERVVGTYAQGGNPLVMGADALTTALASPTQVGVSPGGDVYLYASPRIYREHAGMLDTFSTALSPGQMAVSSNYLYVPQASAGNVVVFPTTAVGPSVAPVRTITGLQQPAAVAATDDDSVVLVLAKGVIRHINPDGTSFIVAGGGPTDPSTAGAPVPALQAFLPSTAVALARADDGTLYIGDPISTRRVFKVSTDGFVAVYAGNGSVNPGGTFPPDGTACTAFPIRPDGLAVGPDGVYIASSLDRRVYRCGASGVSPTLTPVASATGSPVPTQTAALTSTPSRTATLAPTATATATKAPTCVPMCVP